MPVMGNIPPDYIPLKGSARIYAEKGIINLNELISLTLWLVFKKYFLIKNAFKMMFKKKLNFLHQYIKIIVKQLKK